MNLIWLATALHSRASSIVFVAAVTRPSALQRPHCAAKAPTGCIAVVALTGTGDQDVTGATGATAARPLGVLLGVRHGRQRHVARCGRRRRWHWLLKSADVVVAAEVGPAGEPRQSRCQDGCYRHGKDEVPERVAVVVLVSILVGGCLHGDLDLSRPGSAREGQ